MRVAPNSKSKGLDNGIASVSPWWDFAGVSRTVDTLERRPVTSPDENCFMVVFFLFFKICFSCYFRVFFCIAEVHGAVTTCRETDGGSPLGH